MLGSMGDTNPMKRHLVGMTTADLAELPVLSGEPAYRIRQIASLERPQVLERAVSEDGSTTKLLLGLTDGHRIETVLIRAAGRDTICVSTQVGCAYGCRFCATGAMGWTRNLTPHEIVAQALLARDELTGAGASGHFNLVFMGMGEPLANYDHLVASIAVLHEDHGMAVGRRRMTVSTVGLIPGIAALAREPVKVRLAVSLNATDDHTRAALMPVARTYPLARLIPAVGHYARLTGQRVTFEYVLISRINDRRADAKRLAAFARQAGATINLIPFNAHPLSELRPSPPERVRRFHDALLPLAPTVTLRESKGSDIRAACGQLSTAYGSRVVVRRIVTDTP